MDWALGPALSSVSFCFQGCFNLLASFVALGGSGGIAILLLCDSTMLISRRLCSVRPLLFRIANLERWLMFYSTVVGAQQTLPVRNSSPSIWKMFSDYFFYYHYNFFLSLLKLLLFQHDFWNHSPTFPSLSVCHVFVFMLYFLDDFP